VAIDALVFVIGIYVLALVIALFVGVVIVAIRRLTAERVKVAAAGAESSAKAKEATT